MMDKDERIKELEHTVAELEKLLGLCQTALFAEMAAMNTARPLIEIGMKRLLEDKQPIRCRPKIGQEWI